MATQKKIDTVNDLSEKVTKATSIILADFKGLTHKQLEELRKEVKKTDGEFVVVKNRLFTRALGKNADKLAEHLKDSTAALFSYSDEVAPLKAMKTFFKAQNLGTSKGGLLGDSQLSVEEVDRLASLPAKPTLLGQLVGQLNAPIQGLHYALNWNLNRLVWALNSVKEKKQA